MPRISSLATAASTLQAACDLVGEANGLNSLSSLSRMKQSYSGFGEGVCTCARCMRRAGPIREDVENKLVQIKYALANVYDDSPDLDMRVTEEHRARAEEMMGCVESGDVIRLREIFLEIEDSEAEGVLEPGTAPEIATYLIISAAQVGQAEIIRLLAEWDADMEETDSIRRGRPLMHAANNGHTAAVKALVDCGADPEATDDNGYTALMVAVFSDRSSAAEALLEGGAHVDTPDRAGRTALSYAAMYGSTDCIYLLAGRGADVGHVDADGNTPLELAEGSGRQSAVDALKKLQLRVKMQEKRKVKQSRTRGGCAELDAAELRAKEQEAARAAAELLEQLEKEEAARAAAKAAAGSASAKKKKKGKGKIGLLEQDAADDALSAAPEPQQQQQHLQVQQVPTKQQQPQQRQQLLSNGSSGWDALHDSRQGREDAIKSSVTDGSSHSHSHKQQQHQVGRHAQDGPHQLASRSSSELHREPAAIQDHQLAPGTPGGASTSADGCGGSGSELFGDEGNEALRREWEALLEAAARCKEARQQPQMLTRVTEMLPRCAEAGISVKYGRKVLQRLQAVDPARKALSAALTARSPRLPELEEALGAAKVCRCLLEDDLLQRAEAKLALLQQQQQQAEKQRELKEQQEQQARLQQQQQEEQLRLQQQRAEEVRQQQRLQQQQEQQQREREMQRQRELDAQRKQQALRQQQEQEQLRKQQQEQEEERARQKQEAAARRAWEQQQQQRLQADQAAIAAAAAAGKPATVGVGSSSDPISPRVLGRPQPAVGPPEPPRLQQQQQPEVQQQLVPEDPELPPQQLPSRQQQLQQFQQHLQQQQQPLSPHVPPPLSAQQPGPGLFQQQPLQQQSRLSMLASTQPQQLVSNLQQQALQSLHGASSSALLTQQQQQERHMAMQLLEQAAAAQTAISSALPLGPLLQDSQLQQQQALTQLQLLHQQRMLAAQLQGQAAGALQGNGSLPQLGSGGLLGAGSGPGVGGVQGQLLGSGSLGSQGLPPGGQLAQLQRQQQQQHLASSFWGASAASDALLSPGSYGSVGQPVPGRLSSDLGPPAGSALGLAGPGPSRADMARAGSLGAVGGPSGAALRGVRGPNLGVSTMGGLAPGSRPLLGGGGVRGVEADMLDDHQHPAFSMANAVLDDDERDVMGLGCRLCGEGRANTCCLPCGCLCMCASCAGRWRQQDLTGVCPFCMKPLEDFAVVS